MVLSPESDPELGPPESGYELLWPERFPAEQVNALHQARVDQNELVRYRNRSAGGLGPFPDPGPFPDTDTDLPLHPILGRAFDRLFRPAIEARLTLEALDFSEFYEHNEVLITARFSFDELARASTPRARRTVLTRMEVGELVDYYSRERRVRGENLLQSLIRLGRTAYAQMAEDVLFGDEIHEARQEVFRLMRVNASHAEIADAQVRLSELREHGRRHHGLGRVAWSTSWDRGDRDRTGYASARNAFDAFRLDTEMISALEPMQLPEATRRIIAERFDGAFRDQFYRQCFGSFESNAIPPPVAPSIRGNAAAAARLAAEAKGIALLRENLTPEQRTSLDRNGFFDVTGGTTSRRYRIRHGRQMNVYELGRSGTPICGRCFLPADNLVTGDVMLAQKNALELFEREALGIANAFQDERHLRPRDVAPDRSQEPRLTERRLRYLEEILG